jgi:hypothetical protein
MDGIGNSNSREERKFNMTKVKPAAWEIKANESYKNTLKLFAKISKILNKQVMSNVNIEGSGACIVESIRLMITGYRNEQISLRR